MTTELKNLLKSASPVASKKESKADFLFIRDCVDQGAFSVAQIAEMTGTSIQATAARLRWVGGKKGSLRYNVAVDGEMITVTSVDGFRAGYLAAVESGRIQLAK